MAALTCSWMYALLALVLEVKRREPDQRSVLQIMYWIAMYRV